MNANFIIFIKTRSNMLKLKEINKNYLAGENEVKALKNINVEFRENEFVSILGPSGSGKTTLLNIIGGLDHYTSGDLLINGKTTKDYKDSDWDSYRNSTIGFVFQNYNLIAHLSVLGNVELALTLSGISPRERRNRALEALNNVGLSDQINKKPNQLSGGQMQRVAIARALVNNPGILLADEPTGALDTVTSGQIMDLLKEIAKDRLVIMVSHNTKIAEKYSTRIVKLLDGKIIDDSMPFYNNEEYNIKNEKYKKGKKSSMSFWTALKLSFRNLTTKKARTVITSIAGSIGIIGIALVLAIGNGMNNYVSTMQSDTLSGFPLSIYPVSRFDMNFGKNNNDNAFIEEDIIYPYDQMTDSKQHYNIISDEYIEFLDNMDNSLYNSISYTYGLKMNLVGKTDANEYKLLNSENLRMQQLPASDEFVNSQYDLLYGNYPQNSSEAVLIVDKNNKIDVEILNELGVPYNEETTFKSDNFIGRTIKVIYNDNYYNYNDQTQTFYPNMNYESLFNSSENKDITIIGVLRVKEDASSSMLDRGIGYKSSLTEEILQNSKDSQIVQSQKNNTVTNVITGLQLVPNEYDSMMIVLGGKTTPISINIYPISFSAKNQIKTYLDKYNNDKLEANKVFYTDLGEMITSTMGKLIDTISLILSAFAAISLLVSSIMIGIITYVSVVERTKEIGVLRSLGARKKDISRVFNAETIIIGFTAGIIGIIVTMVLSVPINIIAEQKVQVANIAKLPILSAIGLIGISMLLTFIAGIIPSSIAAKKDPVEALRSE